MDEEVCLLLRIL